EALDVRVLADVGAEAQPAGDLGVGLRELRGQAADVRQLAVVVGQQLVAHQLTPLTSTSPVPGRTVESKTTGSGAGAACSRASMRKRRVRSSGSLLVRSCTLTVLKRGSNWRSSACRLRAKSSRSLGELMLAPVKSGMP